MIDSIAGNAAGAVPEIRPRDRSHEGHQQQSASSGGDSVQISEEGRGKAREMRMNEGRGQEKEQGEKPADTAARGMQALTEDKDEVVKDLQDTESDIRSVKDAIRQAKVSPSSSEEERQREVDKLENKLDRLEDEASDKESKLAADE